MRLIGTVLQILERVTAVAIAILVALIMVIVVGQLVDRHFVDLPWDAPDQYARIAIVWLCFLGSALALSQGASIRIDLLDHWLPERFVAWRDLLFDLAILGILLLLTVKAWTVVKVGSMQVLLGTPFTADVPYAGFLVGSGLAAIFVAIRIARRLVGPMPAREK